MGELIALKYTGAGAYRPDVPARDLDRADIALLSDAQRVIAVSCGLYEATFEVAEPEAKSRHEQLGAMTKAELRHVATEQGLDLPTKTTNPELVEAIEANEAQLADEAQASSDGEGTSGGDATPGDDPDASATGEPGTPPVEPGG